VCVSLAVIERLAELTIVATECLILEITQQSRYSHPGTQARFCKFRRRLCDECCARHRYSMTNPKSRKCERSVMNKVLAFVLSVATNAAALTSLESISSPDPPRGEVYITELDNVSPAQFAAVTD
jgi:hypothetical protein